MRFLLAIPAILSCIVLGAHFLRAGNLWLAVLCVGVPMLLLARRTWTVRVVQVSLLLGSLEWVRTLIRRIDEYEASGRDWRRMVIILASVAAFTFVSMLLLFACNPRRRADALHDQPNASAA